VIETGWLLDTGTLCLGTGWCHSGMDLVTYTSPTAIRFARMEDAVRMLKILCLLSPVVFGASFKPVEHQWG
jgi:hypothetical protein